MTRYRIVPLLALAAGVLLGLAPLDAGPSASSDIGDLAPGYLGRSYSNDGTNEGANIGLQVTSKDGNSFQGTFSYAVTTLMGVGASGLGPVPLTGKVTAKGKLTANGTIGDDKFTLKGTLSDQGKLILAEYVRKSGKTVVFKALWWLEED